MIDWDAQVIGPLQKVFGERVPVIYMPAVGAPFPISGIFDKAFQKEDLFEDGSAKTNTVAPVLGVRLSEFPNPPLPNDRLFIDSVKTTYVVRDPRVDGHGGAKLMLNKVSSP